LDMHKLSRMVSDVTAVSCLSVPFPFFAVLAFSYEVLSAK